MAYRLLVFLFLGFGWIAAAKPDEERLKQQYFELQDSSLAPQEAYARLNTFILTVNKEAMPALWSDIVVTMINMEVDSNTGKIWTPRMDEVLELTQRLQLKPQRLMALLIKAQIDSNRRPHDEILQLFKQATDLCEELKDLLLCNRAWLEFAFYNYTMRDYPVALMGMQKALKFLDEKNPTQETAMIDTKNYLAILLAAVGDFPKARPLYEESIAFARRVGDTYREMVIEFNLASGFVQNLDTYPPNLAREHFENSLRLARRLDKPDLIGWVLGGLGEFHAKSGEPLQALVMLDEASRSMPKDTWVRQIANVEKTRARALVRLKRFAESQKSVEKALALIPKEAAEDHNELLSIQYEIAIGQNRRIDALYLLQQYHESVVKLTRDRQKRQLQTLQASIGLQTEELRSAELREKNRIQSLELEKTERLRRLFMVIAVLSVLIGLALFAVIWKDRQVKREKKSLQHILDSIQEGILRIRSDGTIGDHSSKHSSVLFAEFGPLAGLKPGDLLFETGDTKAQVEAALQSILGEDAIAWEFNSALLPLTIERKGRQLSLYWHPVLWNSRVQELILTVRDVTDISRYEKELRAERGRNETLVDGLMEIMSRKPDQALAFIQTLPARFPTWRILVQEQNWIRLRTELHTLKGNSRMLGLKSFADPIHALEGVLQDPINREPMLAAFENFATERSRIFASLGQMGRKTLWDLCGEIFDDLRGRLQGERMTIKSLQCRDAVTDWTDMPLDRIRDILIHACNNAIDHGYVLPFRDSQWTAAVELSIETSEEQGRLILRVIDGGVGLNWTRIQDIAAKKHFRPAQGRPLSDVLFLPEVSTAEQVTLTSGRGVGLAAIASLCQEIQGDCRLIDRDQGRGTELRVELPGSISSSQPELPLAKLGV